MRARWAATVAVVAAVVLGSPLAASATDPVELRSAYVIDESGVISASDLTTVEERLGALYDATSTDLYVAIVPSFTNPSDSEEWANSVASLNGMGINQYLLAISTEGSQYYISADSAGPMTFSQLDKVEQAIVPDLRAGDFAGAIITAADEFEAALNGTGPAASGGLGFLPGLLIALVVIAVIALVIWLIVRSRRTGGKGATAKPIEQRSTQDLAREASSLLVETDDAIKTSEQELGFARAQFGDSATDEFVQTLERAKASLTQAFLLKQQLDDSTPDTEEQVRAWNAQIIDLCTTANRELDEKAAAFDELRKLEQNAPEALARVQQERTEVGADITAAESALAGLRARYAPEALVTVADNPQQASALLQFADEQLAQAQSDLAAGRGGEAAVGIRAAEDAVAQARLLETSIDTHANALAEGAKSAAELVADLEKDLATASTLPDPDGRIAGVIASTRTQVEQARANLAGAAMRPLFTLQNLEAANEQIDTLIAGVRDAQQRAQRAQQMLGQTIMQAQAQVSAAEDFITSRRGAIGAEARTRLAEAGAALVQAKQLQASSPEQALPLAQHANQLAAQAIQSAQSDVGAFNSYGGGGGGGGGNMLGAVLGGIVINSLLSGGGGRGRSGGRRSTGGFSGFGGGGFSGGGSSRRSGRSAGSFGGGGTRSRRGGGRF